MEDAVAVIDRSCFQRLAFVLVHVLQTIAKSTVAGEGTDMAIAEAEVAVGVMGDAVAAVTIRIAALGGATVVDVGELRGAAAVDVRRAVGVTAGDHRRSRFHHAGDKIRAVVLGVTVIDMGDKMGRRGEIVGDAAVGGIGVVPNRRRGTSGADTFGRRGRRHVAIGLHEIHPLGRLEFDKTKHVMVVLLVHAHAEDDLLQVVDAADGAGLLTGLREGWQQHGSQNRDDGDDNQKFDQCEMTILFHGWFLLFR